MAFANGICKGLIMPGFGVGVKIDISDITSDTNNAIGLFNGVLGWSTIGLAHPIGWKTGILLPPDEMSPPIRMIDLTTGGGYGTLSGFKFGVVNTDAFWNVLQANGYYIINRPVDVFTFLAEVATQIWAGIVSHVAYDELRYNIHCKSLPVDALIPNVVLNENSFPNIIDKAINKLVPICIGNINKAELLPVYNDLQPVVVSQGLNGVSTSASMADYNSATRSITLYTANVYIMADQYAGYYLHIVVNGGGESIQIESHTVTDTSGGDKNNYKTTFVLVGWFSASPTADNAVDSTPGGTEIWYAEIVKYTSVHIVSSGQVYSIEGDDVGHSTKLEYYNKDLEEYINVSDLAKSEDGSNIHSTGHPGVEVIAKSKNIQGDIKRLAYIQPIEIIGTDVDVYPYNNFWGGIRGFGDGYTDLPNLYDKDISTNEATGLSTTGQPGNAINIKLRIKIPPQSDFASFDNVYMLFDSKITRGAGGFITYSLNYHLRSIDNRGRITDNIKSVEPLFSGALEGAEDNIWLRTIPYEYYGVSGYNSTFGDKRGDMDVSVYVTDTDYLKAYPYFQMYLQTDITSTWSGNPAEVSVYEVVFVGVKTISTTKETLYTKIRGEIV